MRKGMGFGLSKRKTGYGGGGAAVPEADVIRVRRSSDSTEADYNLTEWDDGTLDTFVGAGDGCLATWYDDSGNDNHVTQSTTTLQPKVAISGVVQEGVVFDGINDYLTKGARLTSGSIAALTVAAFVKTAGNGCVCGEINGTGNQRSWSLYVTSTKFRVYLSLDGGSTNIKDYSSTETVNDGTWRHLAFVFSAGTLTMYINGSAITPTKTVDNAVASLFNTSAHFIIGALNAGAALSIAASVSGLHVVQAALTAPQIATLAAGGEVGSPLLWLKGNYSP